MRKPLVLLALLACPMPVIAAPTFRAPLTAVLQADVDHSGSVSCGDILRYTLTLEPQSEFGTDFQEVAFDLAADTDVLFDPASLSAVNSDQTVTVSADPLALHVEFGRACNSANCPPPPLRLTFNGQIRVLNTGSAVSIQGRVSGRNFATVFTDGTPNAQVEPTVTPYPPCPPAALLRATKTWALVGDIDADGRVDPNDTVRYTVSVQNAGTVSAAGVQFDSDTDPNSALVAGSVTTSRGSVVQGNAPGATHVRVAVGSLAANASASITFEARVRAPFPAGISEMACQGTVSSTSGAFSQVLTDDPSTPAANDPTRTPIDFDPDLSLGKSDGGALATPGSALVYTLTVTNLSSRAGAANVVLTETVPQNTTFAGIGSSPGWSCAGGNCTLNAGSISPSGTLVRTFAVVPANPMPAGVASIANTARVSDDGANGPDPDLGNNVATERTALDGTAARPDLTLGKDDGGVSVRPGETVAYTLSYANRGNRGATGVRLTETVPNNSSFAAAASSPGWTCASGGSAGSTCTLDRGALAGGGASGTAVFAVTVEAVVPTGIGRIINSASIADDGTNGPDADPADNVAEDATPLSGLAPDLRLAKSLDPASGARPGDILLWNLDWTNAGNQDATGVTLTDTIPAHTTFDAAGSTAGWSCLPGGFPGSVCAFSLGLVAAGTAGRTVLALRIDDSLPAGLASIENCARIGGGAPSCAGARIAASPDLALVKDDGGISAHAGDTVVYQLRYENRGDQGATGVVLTETVPAHGTFAASGSSAGWSCSPGPAAGSTCTLFVGSLAAGAAGTASFAVRLDAPLPSGLEQIVNTASVADDGTNGPEPDLANNLASDTTPVSGAEPGPQPSLTATMADSLSVDLGTPGEANAGDTVTYTVVLTNAGPGPALDTVFQSGTDPHTALVVGSATTTQGTVTLGNQAGATLVQVEVGTIPAGGTAIITFEAKIASSLPPAVTEIACQGVVLAGSGPRIRTDDPDTAEPADPTRTPIARGGGPQVVDIPTLGEVGLLVSALLLAAVALPRLRRRTA